MPIGLMDYIADCEAGSPTLLAITIATSFKNVASGSNISLSLSWSPPPPSPNPPASPASLPRFSLLGYLERIEEEEVKGKGIKECFLDMHKDARFWLPGNRIHESEWVRLVVQQVYWIGGFGDRAYIGWIPVEEWRNVTREEWEGVRLPGEKSGKEWGLDFWRQWDL
jgi:Pyridoxamine 5'-phosphate oxidase